jgi:hypothetical protein
VVPEKGPMVKSHQPYNGILTEQLKTTMFLLTLKGFWAEGFLGNDVKWK